MIMSVTMQKVQQQSTRWGPLGEWDRFPRQLRLETIYSNRQYFLKVIIISGSITGQKFPKLLGVFVANPNNSRQIVNLEQLLWLN